jgi:hypothetical protein
MPKCPLFPPPQLLWMDAALALMALRISASCVYAGSPWMLGSVGVGKLLMSASGDGDDDDAMLDWEGLVGSCSFLALLGV